ncbi:hypothetical protein OG500_23150 [Kitasatospora sp. NBC_01250]|nr:MULTISPECIES: hypothetical protein [unclassified Kitasatospora]WSJ68976.1 hypothetical protein OG294_24255 [Kitasatospora sp. NBC_01302]
MGRALSGERPTAHLEHGDVTVVTSDTDDLRLLCDARIAVEQI